MPIARKSFIVLLFSLSIALVLAGCLSKPNTAPPSEKLKVVASVYPVYEFARQVGGEKVELTMLVPPGAEPHDWEPTAREIIQIKSAKLFLYHGAGLENLGKVLTQDTLGATRAVAVSQGLTVLEEADEDEHGHDQHSGEHGDSHMWLDPVYAQQEVAAIANALAEADPANADYYRQNADRYTQELSRLDQEYRAALSGLPRREIVVSHAAFGYLAARYNLTQRSIMGLAPDSEPTPDKMAQVVAFCREHNVKYIFFETLVNPKLSQTVARETGASLLVLNPIENLTQEEVNQGKNYLSLMRDNLANLKTALSE
ncbi:MAG TPA: zinc ABC transporter substrate-binding protein [Selenomonadales bacterium]|nr:zinc ABC transporter substrate-binding protein [Selenomonadales bacterium]